MTGQHPQPGQSSTGGLPWAKPMFGPSRCHAAKEPNASGHHGRCELAAGHEGDHALERGMDTPRWSTRWTA